jgi:hypothetical protein
MLTARLPSRKGGVPDFSISSASASRVNPTRDLRANRGDPFVAERACLSPCVSPIMIRVCLPGSEGRGAVAPTNGLTLEPSETSLVTHPTGSPLTPASAGPLALYSNSPRHLSSSARTESA